MYTFIVFLHVISILAFMLAHGASVAAAFVLRRETNPQRIRALIGLSGATYGVTYASLLGLLLFGVIAGFMGNWWGSGWIWVSLVLLVVIYLAMGGLGSRYYGMARLKAGLPARGLATNVPEIDDAAEAEMTELVRRVNPITLTVIGYGGVAIITYLMIAKPF
jgi:MFS family permease